MLRRLIEELGIFLIPFALFCAYLLVTGRNPLRRGHWDGQSLRLALAGLALVIVSLIVTGLFSERSSSGYVPSHMENGRLVPGQFR